MKIDFQNHVNDFVSVPAGTYLCKISEVIVGSTRAGDERWGLRLVVAEGEFVGRHAAWDGLVFSARGMTRVGNVLAALGLPTNGTVELQPDDLLDRPLFVEVRPGEYQHPDTGRVVRRNEVPYEGYSPVQPSDAPPKDGEGKAPGVDTSLPF